MYHREVYEQIAPAVCKQCGGSDFERHGRIGRWDGFRGGGCIYKAVCRSCQTTWNAHSDPFVCKDAPQSIRWFQGAYR